MLGPFPHFEIVGRDRLATRNILGGNDHQLIYMLAWESLDERMEKFGKFGQDPERARVFHASEANGPIVEQVRNTILRPTDFSPMK